MEVKDTKPTKFNGKIPLGFTPDPSSFAVVVQQNQAGDPDPETLPQPHVHCP